MPAPERGTILLRFARLLEDEKQELTELMSREMGKVLAEAGRRRPGGDRHVGLHGRRGPPPLRPHDALRAARQVPDVGADADRRRRRDHAVELPDRDPGVEAHAGARLRQHGRPEAGGGHAAPGRALHRAARRGGTAGRRRQPRPRLRGGGGRPPRAPSGRARDHLHRLARDGRGRDEGRGGQPQARPPRARRQERDHRPRRRRSRPGRRGHRLVGLRHLGPALHRREPRDRPGGCPRRAAAAAGRAGRADADRPRLGAGHRPRPRDQPGGAREDPLVHRDRLRTKVPSSSPAARSRARASSARASSTGRRSSRTSSRRCGSRRRRSSARRPR